MLVPILAIAAVLLLCVLATWFVGGRRGAGRPLRVASLASCGAFGLLLVYFAVHVLMLSAHWKATRGARIDQTSTGCALVVVDLMTMNTRPEVNRLVDRKQSDRVIAAVNRSIYVVKQYAVETVFLTSAYERRTLLRSVFTPNIAVRGSREAQVDPGLLTEGCRVFNKLGADGFSSGEFDTYLRDRRIRTVFVTGTATEACVHYTVMGALNRGYAVFVIRDGLYSLFGGRSAERFSSRWEAAGAEVIGNAELEDILKASCMGDHP